MAADNFDSCNSNVNGRRGSWEYKYNAAEKMRTVQEDSGLAFKSLAYILTTGPIYGSTQLP